MSVDGACAKAVRAHGVRNLRRLVKYLIYIGNRRGVYRDATFVNTALAGRRRGAASLSPGSGANRRGGPGGFGRPKLGRGATKCYLRTRP
jgi:hypothetical protein